MAKANFSIEISNPQALKRFLSKVEEIERNQEKITRAALVETMKQVKTQTSNLIRNDPAHGLNLKKSYVDGKIQTSYVGTDLNGRVYAEKRGTLVSNFNNTQRLASGGYSIKTIRNRPAKKWKYAFAISGKNSGATVIMARTSRADRKNLWRMKKTSSGTKKPYIQVLYGPSPSQAYQQILPKLKPIAFEVFEKQIQRQIDRIKRGY